MTHRTQHAPRPRGFGGMDPERQRQIASAGGRAAHASGRAYKFSSEEARAAGQKGGASVSQDRAHMASIGQRGGQARQRKQAGGTTPGSDEAPLTPELTSDPTDHGKVNDDPDDAEHASEATDRAKT